MLQNAEVAAESDGIRRIDRQELPTFGGPTESEEQPEPEPQAGEQQLRQLRSEPAPEPTRAPIQHPAHKYEQTNFREPVKMPLMSQEPNPIIR